LLPVALANRAGIQAYEVSLGSGTLAQKRSRQRASLVTWQAVRQLARGTDDRSRQFYFPLGLRIGNTGAVDGEKLNSCFMNSAQQFCHLLDCRTYLVTVKTLRRRVENGQANDKDLTFVKFTLMRMCP